MTAVDAPEGALKLDLPTGGVRIVEAYTVENLTQAGWRLIATFVEQRRETKWVQGPTQYGPQVEQTTVTPVRMYILWLDAESTLIAAGKARDEIEDSRQKLRGEIYNLKEQLSQAEPKFQEELRKANAAHDQQRREAERWHAEFTSVTSSMKALQNLHDKLSKSLHDLVQDPDVALAMHAAIAAGDPATTKDLLLHYLYLLKRTA